MRTIQKLLLVTCSLAAVGTVHAQSTPLFGVTVGGYFPTDSEMRDLVGKSFLQFGFSPSAGVTKEKYSIRPEFTFLGGSGNGNRFSIFAVPITVTMPLGVAAKDGVVPYVAAGFGLTYFDYNITRPGPTNVRDSGIGTIAHVEGGVVFNDRVRLSARYNMLSESNGFNFNGFQVGISWQFFRL